MTYDCLDPKAELKNLCNLVRVICGRMTEVLSTVCTCTASSTRSKIYNSSTLTTYRYRYVILDFLKKNFTVVIVIFTTHVNKQGIRIEY
jgi:hypothetical protein